LERPLSSSLISMGHPLGPEPLNGLKAESVEGRRTHQP
jgi:hypothetical protein